MGSSLVAFMMSPLILSFPDMNSRWALPLPETRFAKSASDSERVTTTITGQHSAERRQNPARGILPVGFSPRPLPTVPVFFRSMCQLSVSPAAFFSVKAKTAFPCLIASFLSASLVSASLMASKAAEEGNLSAGARHG